MADDFEIFTVLSNYSLVINIMQYFNVFQKSRFSLTFHGTAACAKGKKIVRCHGLLPNLNYAPNSTKYVSSYSSPMKTKICS